MPKLAQHFAKLEKTFKNLPKTCKLLPKWRYFAKFGHTGKAPYDYYYYFVHLCARLVSK